jgi:hypothetical protein
MCLRPSQLKTTGKNFDGFCWDRWIEHRKSSIRCKVEHPFLIVKRQFPLLKSSAKSCSLQAKNLMGTDTKKALKLLCFKASVRETGLEVGGSCK